MIELKQQVAELMQQLANEQRSTQTVRDEKAKVVQQLERNGKESEAIKAKLEERLHKADALERELHVRAPCRHPGPIPHPAAANPDPGNPSFFQEKVKAAFDAEKAAMAEKERVQEQIDTLQVRERGGLSCRASEHPQGGSRARCIAISSCPSASRTAGSPTCLLLPF